MEKVFITKKHIADNDFSEIDFDLHEEFGFSYDEHEEFVEIQSGRAGGADAYPIKIDRMIEALEALKEKGATHVELDYHCDHIGYEVSGYRIEPATHDQIIEWYAKRNKKNENDQRIAELQAEIEKLRAAN